MTEENTTPQNKSGKKVNKRRVYDGAYIIDEYKDVKLVKWGREGYSIVYGLKERIFDIHVNSKVRLKILMREALEDLGISGPELELITIRFSKTLASKVKVF